MFDFSTSKNNFASPETHALQSLGKTKKLFDHTIIAILNIALKEKHSLHFSHKELHAM